MALRLNITGDSDKASTDDGQDTTPMFLLKLVHLLKEPGSEPYVSWNEDGTSFIVHDPTNFSKYVLPKYFKHNKFASFVRQLNIYGFRKVSSLHKGSLKDDTQQVEFYHPYFLEDNTEMLQFIKRKAHTVIPKQTSDDVAQVLDDIHDVKSSQKKLTNSLADLKQENESLWREVVSLRQKHSQQQKVVNHLIKFLVSVVQHHGMGTKRRYPLMIDEGSSSTSPSQKISRQNSQITLDPVASTPNPEVVIDQIQENLSPADGPLITELLSTSSSPACPQKVDQEPPVTSSQNDDAFDISDLMKLSKVPSAQTGYVGNASEPASAQTEQTNIFDSISSPSDTAPVLVEPNSFLNLPTNSASDFHANSPSTTAILEPPATSSTSAVAIPGPSLDQTGAVDSLSFDMDKISNNLESIKSRLTNNEQINLDYDILQELFNGQADLSQTPNMFDYSLPMNVPVPEGNELVQYSGDGLLPRSSVVDESNVDYSDMLESLN